MDIRKGKMTHLTFQGDRVPHRNFNTTNPLTHPHLEAHVGGINGYRDWANCCHSNLKIVFTLGLDIYIAGESCSNVASLEPTLLILHTQKYRKSFTLRDLNILYIRGKNQDKLYQRIVFIEKWNFSYYQ